jgi:hypothetical protein
MVETLSVSEFFVIKFIKFTLILTREGEEHTKMFREHQKNVNISVRCSIRHARSEFNDEIYDFSGANGQFDKARRLIQQYLLVI